MCVRKYVTFFKFYREHMAVVRWTENSNPVTCNVPQKGQFGHGPLAFVRRPQKVHGWPLLCFLYFSKPLVSCVEGQLIAAHVGFMLNKGLSFLVSENRTADLQRFYTLLSAVKDGTQQLCDRFTEHVKVSLGNGSNGPVQIITSRARCLFFAVLVARCFRWSYAGQFAAMLRQTAAQGSGRGPVPVCEEGIIVTCGTKAKLIQKWLERLTEGTQCGRRWPL